MDIECYKNYFCLGLKDYNTKKITFYEISEERNELEQIHHYMTTFKGFLITFNGLHYDEPVLNHLVLNYPKYKYLNALDTCLDLKYFSDKIINDVFDDEDVRKAKWYKKQYISIDLFAYWSKMLRISKKMSLKALGIQLGYPIVQELPYKPDSILTIEDLPKLRYYNYTHDLGILEMLVDSMESQIIQRRDAVDKFKFKTEAYSWDGVKLGLNILLKEYCIENNTTIKDIKDLRTEFPTRGIKVKDLLLPQISFKETPQQITTSAVKGVTVYNCNSFYTLFESLRNRILYSTKELSYSVLSNNVKYDIKSGGLHSWHENDIVEPDLTKVIYRDIDVSSYYPSLGSEYGFVPKHLPGMDKVIKRLKTMRVKYKNEGNKKDAELYKLALNGGYYGNLNNEYSAMYDPTQLLSVTLNGQLFLLMLCEWLEEAGIQIDMVNTDGITAIIPIEKESIFKELYHKWEILTRMELEEVDYTKVVRKNINNYLAVSSDGKVKKKGLFKYGKDIPLGDSVDELIIPKALEAYYLHNIQPREFISNPEKYNLHIFDFCKSNKISKDFTVWWNSEIQQQLNRYYFSKNGPYLFKQKKGSGTMQSVNVGQGVKLYNNHVELDWNKREINYSYYISATQKIIDELNNLNQLSLF